MADGGSQILVLFMAIFLVPQLMRMMPDFDPLMMIVLLFVGLAGVQQLGFAAGQPGGEQNGSNQSSSQQARRRREENEEQSSAAAPSLAQLLKDARRAIDQNSYASAEGFAKRATDLDPESAEAWELLATALKWAGKRKQAAEAARTAIDTYEVKSPGLEALVRELEKSEEPGAVAKECAAKADDFFAKSQYDLALDCYSQAIDALDGESAAEQQQSDELVIQMLRRRAECAQQLQDWSMCRRDATAVLERSPDDVQALLRRAAANEALEKFSAALDDARRLLAVDPRNAAANRIAHNCKQALREGGG